MRVFVAILLGGLTSTLYALATTLQALEARRTSADSALRASLLETLVRRKLWLLGTATGPNVEALHGSRLRMMLEKTTDTTVRAVLYEAAGTVDPAVLEAGAAELALAQTLNEIPGALLEADPRDVDPWVTGARDAIEHLLTVDRRSARLGP